MATGVIRAINSGINMAFTIPASGWTSTSPYTYTWTNAKVTDGCHVTVEFYSTNTNIETPYIEYEKVSGGIQFTAPSKPSTDMSVVAHIISAQDGPYANIDGTMVATDAVTGAANTTEALSALNANLITINDQITACCQTIWFYYNDNAWTKTEQIIPSGSTSALITVECWLGNASYCGLYMALFNVSGHSLTTIKEATGTTLSLNQRTLTINATNRYTGVRIIALH